MRILGVDYGLKRIGLALADSGLAEPLQVIKRPACHSAEKVQAATLHKIVTVCRQFQIEKVVVGLPEGKLVPQVKKFGKELARLAKLDVVYQDETLTSQDAVAKMIEAGKKKKDRQIKNDAAAAAVILQNYLDFDV